MKTVNFDTFPIRDYLKEANPQLSSERLTKIGIFVDYLSQVCYLGEYRDQYRKALKDEVDNNIHHYIEIEDQKGVQQSLKQLIDFFDAFTQWDYMGLGQFIDGVFTNIDISCRGENLEEIFHITFNKTFHGIRWGMEKSVEAVTDIPFTDKKKMNAWFGQTENIAPFQDNWSELLQILFMLEQSCYLEYRTKGKIAFEAGAASLIERFGEEDKLVKAYIQRGGFTYSLYPLTTFFFIQKMIMRLTRLSEKDKQGLKAETYQQLYKLFEVESPRAKEAMQQLIDILSNLTTHYLYGADKMSATDERSTRTVQ